MAEAYIFGPYLLVPERQTLKCGHGAVRVGGRALDLLTTLVARAGETISKNDLMASVWPSVTVEEHNLKVHMSALRRALGDCREAPLYIATIAGRGYRFVSPVAHRTVPDFPHWNNANFSARASAAAGEIQRLPSGGVAATRLEEIARLGTSCASAEIVLRDDNVSLHFKLDRIEALANRP